MTPFEIYKKAHENKYAIGQFNVSTLEAVKAVVRVAKELNASVIIGTSENEAKYLGMKNIADIIENARQEMGLPIVLNLDHGKSLEKVKEAIGVGYNAVHFDGSALPLEENIAITKEIVEYAHSKNILVEGEIGHLQGSSSVIKETIDIKEGDLTSPEQVANFVKVTGIDSLGTALGNFHGMYSKEVGGEEKIDLERLKKIRQATETFLVLHGGSGINREQVKEAIQIGIVKINVNTELRVAFRRGLEKALKEKPEEVVPYRLFPILIDEIGSVVKEDISFFGSEGKLI
ncbi:MAG: tagatose-bisphosphate aldolase [Candidatus Portnoybacteria bacterium CG10_big_fil_rev_8_21_14_0_10_36_7]|uniref:Tagatose-bisphosphate aldolase n=1 Tax=Candidatus Portnoybacteria bacterium CG10_big_fil_rev_8_21_14_0_10_36_7 TaxID=1974812 RepID=A0A2M8KET8_9BACT|nr:MAG: tagatose-bisphosphate aldolase [Candidatus Portnoybacteria bacterium CG10_big_fil_rev_8_21_14_0_10_36_7]